MRVDQATAPASDLPIAFPGGRTIRREIPSRTVHRRRPGRQYATPAPSRSEFPAHSPYGLIIFGRATSARFRSDDAPRDARDPDLAVRFERAHVRNGGCSNPLPRG